MNETALPHPDVAASLSPAAPATRSPATPATLSPPLPATPSVHPTLTRKHRGGEPEGPVANGTATGYTTGDPVFREASAKAVAEGASPKVLDPAKALAELATTSLGEIERTTALTWGGRALASYQLSTTQTALIERLRRFHEGEAFRSEAFEHASMAEDNGKLLAAIQLELDVERQAALKLIQGPSSL